MTDPATTLPPSTHNKPPLVLPKEQELLDDLKGRYSEIEKGVTEHQAAFKTYDGKDGNPLELSLKDGDVAKALGDLISQAKKDRKSWKGWMADEKSPLTKLAKVVTNFFTDPVETLEGLLARYEPVMEDYIAKQNAEAERLRQAEIARQRQKEEDARRAAEAAAEQQRQAEAAAAEQRRKEEEARAAAARAEEEKKAAEARAAAAKAEEKRLEDERRARDKAEKERNTSNIRDAKAVLKSAERLNQLAEAEEAVSDELATLTQQIRVGGIISNLMTPVVASMLLDDEQRAAVADIGARLMALRSAEDGRLSKRQAREREKQRQAEEERHRQEQAKREEERKAEQARLEAARAAREAEEAAAARAAEERRQADAAARAAREAARGHEKDVKQAGRAAGQAEAEADRAANRGDRIEGRGESRANVRGDLGSNSGLTRRWCHYVDDETAIRATMGPLGPFLGLEDIKAAAWHWMRAHQEGFQGERVEPAELPGVRFAYEEDLTSR